MALAFISFAAGSKLFLKDLKGRLKSVGLVVTGLVVVEILLGTIVAYLLSSQIEFMQSMNGAETTAVSLLIGTLLVARSPASAIAIIDELKAAGPFTVLMLGVTVVMDVIVIMLFSVSNLIANNIFNDTGENGGEVWRLYYVRLCFAIGSCS